MHKKGLVTFIFLAIFFQQGCSSTEPKGKNERTEKGSELPSSQENQEKEANGNSQKSPEIPANDAATNQSGILEGVSIATEAKVRNYKELFLTFSQLTGIDPFTESLVNEFESRIQGSLPTQNVAAEYTTTHQVGNFKLAALFCREALEQQNSQEIVYGDLSSFDRETQLTRENFEPIAINLIKTLWRQSEISQEEKNGLVDLGLSLVESVQEFNNNASNEQAFEASLIGACTGVLTSAKVFLY